jgi:hypothetical protein
LTLTTTTTATTTATATARTAGTTANLVCFTGRPGWRYFTGPMSNKRCAPSLALRTGRLAGVGALAALSLWGATACEDKALGRPCDLTVDASAAQAAYTTQGTDCPSHLCVKPAVQPGVSIDLDTGPYCTTPCSSDTDCNGQTRDPSNPNDKRCQRGFSCAMIFDKGSLCCKSLCLCRDFFSQAVGPAVPDVCKPDAGLTCS